jgi:hypothetical protein
VVGGNLLTSLWERGVMLGRGSVLRFGDRFEYRETARLLSSLQGVKENRTPHVSNW